MKFQELMTGAISSEQPVWIISGQSNLPDSALAIISDVGTGHIVTSGAQMEFESANLFLMIGSILFSLVNCRINKAPHGQFRVDFDSVVQVYPKVASGFIPKVPVPLDRPSPPMPVAHHATMDAAHVPEPVVERSQHV